MTVTNNVLRLPSDTQGREPLGDRLSRLISPPRSPQCWSDTEHTELICRKILDITHDVKSFLFEAPEGRLFQFEPGQFVTLQLEIDGQQLSRCYTISSPPTRPHLMGITVKRVVGGSVSNWLHDTMIPGGRVTVQAPLGAFTITGQTATKYLFLSAGSGITSLMSMTRTLYDLGSDDDVLFIHNARTPADIIFRRELDAIASMTPNIRVVHICESDCVDDWTHAVLLLQSGHVWNMQDHNVVRRRRHATQRRNPPQRNRPEQDSHLLLQTTQRPPD